MSMEYGVIMISNEHLIRLMKLIALRWRLVFSAGILSALIAVVAVSFQGEKYVYTAILKPSEISFVEGEKQKLLDSKILILEKLRGSGFSDKLSKIFGDNISINAKEIDREGSLISLSLYTTKKLEVYKLFQEVIQVVNQDNLLFIEGYRGLLGLELKDIDKRIEKRNLMMVRLGDCQNLDSIQMISCVTISDANLRAIASDKNLRSRIYWAMDEKNTFGTFVLEETIASKVLKNRYELIAITFFILGCLACIFILLISFFKKYSPNLTNR